MYQKHEVALPDKKDQKVHFQRRTFYVSSSSPYIPLFDWGPNLKTFKVFSFQFGDGMLPEWREFFASCLMTHNSWLSKPLQVVSPQKEAAPDVAWIESPSLFFDNLTISKITHVRMIEKYNWLDPIDISKSTTRVHFFARCWEWSAQTLHNAQLPQPMQCLSNYYNTTWGSGGRGPKMLRNIWTAPNKFYTFHHISV